jgi:hypothetical protein
MSKQTDYHSILLEEIRDQNRAVLESVGDMQRQLSGLATLSALHAVADDVSTIKMAITATNHDLWALDKRVAKLERSGN